MKRTFILCIAALLICSLQITGQSDERGIPPTPPVLSEPEEVQYTYDAAGNRIKRAIITVGVIVPKSAEVEDEEPKDSANEPEVLVYPNPVKEELTIEIRKGDDDENYRFLMFDMTGKMIKEVKQHGNGKFPFDMSMYQFGTYLLIIETGDGKREFKVIKE
jgi:hypothetical protein